MDFSFQHFPHIWRSHVSTAAAETSNFGFVNLSLDLFKVDSVENFSCPEKFLKLMEFKIYAVFFLIFIDPSLHLETFLAVNALIF